MPAPKRPQAQRNSHDSQLILLRLDRQAREALSSFEKKGGDVEVVRKLTKQAIAFKNGPRGITHAEILRSILDKPKKDRKDKEASANLKAIARAITAMDSLYPEGKRDSLYFAGCTILNLVYADHRISCAEEKSFRVGEKILNARSRKLLIKNWLYYLALCQLHTYVRKFTSQPNRILAPLFSQFECRRVSPVQLETEYLRAKEHVAQLPTNLVSAFRSVFQPATGNSTLKRRRS